MTYSKQTWVDNSTPLSAARLNNMENGIATAEASGLATMPRAVLGTSAPQTGLPIGWNKVALDTAIIDTHSGLDTVNKAFKVPTGQAGVYLIDGSAYVNGQIATYLSTIWVNGAASAVGESGGSTYLASSGYAVGVPTGARLLNLNVGDIVNLYAYGTVASWVLNVNVKSWMTVLRVA
jgi:hypothetical protein